MENVRYGERLVFVDVLGEQDGVGAQIDEFLALHDAGDDLRHFLVDQRLASRNGHDGGAALVHGLQRVLDAHALLQDLLRIVDLAAAGAGQVALEQGFQHEDQGISLVAPQFAPGEIFRDPIHLQKRDCHALCYRGLEDLGVRLMFCGKLRLPHQARKASTSAR